MRKNELQIGYKNLIFGSRVAQFDQANRPSNRPSALGNLTENLGSHLGSHKPSTLESTLGSREKQEIPRVAFLGSDTQSILTIDPRQYRMKNFVFKLKNLEIDIG